VRTALRHSAGRCTNTPFIAPALSGIALLDGLPDAECKAKYYKYYGYWTYELRTHPREARAASIQNLCEETLQRGFSQLVILDSDSTQNVLIDFHDCSHLGTE